MKRTRRPTAERRRQIAEAALVILASKGGRRLTSRELATAVGISDGAIFRHFKDKDAIVAAALDAFEDTLGVFEADPSLPPLERLGAFFTHRITRVRARPEILRLAFGDRLQAVAGEAGARRVRKIMTDSVGLVRKCLAEADLPASIDVDVATWMVVGAIRGAAMSTTGPMTDSPEAIWQRVQSVLQPL